MKTIRNLLLALGLLVSVCYPSFAGGNKVGTTGLEFLKLRSAARPLGMNNTFVAVADDISTLASNVSGLATLPEQEFLFTYLNYIDGIGYYNLAYALPAKFGTLGFSFAIQSFTIEEIDVQYTTRGELIMSEMVFSFAYSQKVRDLFAYGIGVDLFSSKIGNYSLSSYGVNLGTLFFAPQHIVIGLSVQNLGPKCAYKADNFAGEKQSLPFTCIIGISKKFFSNSFLLTSEIVKDYSLRGNIGMEYKLTDMLALRTGYKAGYDTGQLTFGMGINYKPEALDRFQFDYAFSPMGELGGTHCFSLIAKF